MLVIATGKKKKVSRSNSETKVYFESFLISYLHQDSFNNDRLMLGSGKEILFEYIDILYECGTKKAVKALSDAVSNVINDDDEQYFERDSLVYYVNDINELIVYYVSRYKYDTKTESTDLYLVNPIDSNDYTILDESIWRNPFKVMKASCQIEKIKEKWTSTK